MLFLFSSVVLCLASSSCIDYRSQGWMQKPVGFRLGLPLDGDYTMLPSFLNVCDLAKLHDSCVSRINEFRARMRLFSNAKQDPGPQMRNYTHFTSNNRCSSAMALGDLFINNNAEDACLGGHANAFMCPLISMRVACAQNACCRRSGRSLKEIEATMFQCLQQMWDEGINQANDAAWSMSTGHWFSMRSQTYTSVSCGFGFTEAGEVWVTQDFYGLQPLQFIPCNCDNVEPWGSDSCGGVCYGISNTPNSAPTNSPPTNSAPTNSAPTNSPPTNSPPTNSPPTNSPPTNSAPSTKAQTPTLKKQQPTSSFKGKGKSQFTKGKSWN